MSGKSRKKKFGSFSLLSVIFKTMITLAPEVGQNLNYIPELVKTGWTVSIGHSDATYDEALRGFAAGANHATHLFNAWREFHHREPGGIGAALDEDQVFVELIADGIHIHPSFIRLAVFRKGVDRVCLITDSLKEVGLPDGTYALGRASGSSQGPGNKNQG